MKKAMGVVCLVLLMAGQAEARQAYRVAKITAYCSCERCCGKSDGITASGHVLAKGDKVIACNWLKFGTKVHIVGLGVFSVQDRGAKSHFGTFKKPVEHFDVWMPKHQSAREFGVQYLKYEVVV